MSTVLSPCTPHVAAGLLVEGGADTLLHHLVDDLLAYPTMDPEELKTHDGAGEAAGPYVAVLGTNPTNPAQFNPGYLV